MDKKKAVTPHVGVWIETMLTCTSTNNWGYQSTVEQICRFYQYAQAIDKFVEYISFEIPY